MLTTTYQTSPFFVVIHCIRIQGGMNTKWVNPSFVVCSVTSESVNGSHIKSQRKNSKLGVVCNRFLIWDWPTGNLAFELFSCYQSLFIPPENQRFPDVFREYRKTSGMKWVEPLWFISLICCLTLPPRAFQKLLLK